MTKAEKSLLGSIESIHFCISSSIDTLKNCSEKKIPLKDEQLQQVYENLKFAFHVIKRAKRDCGININDSLKDSSFEFICDRACKGDPEFQNSLGEYYFSDQENYDLAFEWYKKSADNNNPEGLFNLGQCYENGFGVEQDLEKALECYKSAAIKGNADAQYKLALVYIDSDYVKEDLNLAMSYCKKAAENGYPLTGQRFNAALYLFQLSPRRQKPPNRCPKVG